MSIRIYLNVDKGKITTYELSCEIKGLDNLSFVMDKEKEQPYLPIGTNIALAQIPKCIKEFVGAITLRTNIEGVRREIGKYVYKSATGVLDSGARTNNYILECEAKVLDDLKELVQLIRSNRIKPTVSYEVPFEKASLRSAITILGTGKDLKDYIAKTFSENGIEPHVLDVECYFPVEGSDDPFMSNLVKDAVILLTVTKDSKVDTAFQISWLASWAQRSGQLFVVVDTTRFISVLAKNLRQTGVGCQPLGKVIDLIDMCKDAIGDANKMTEITKKIKGMLSGGVNSN